MAARKKAPNVSGKKPARKASAGATGRKPATGKTPQPRLAPIKPPKTPKGAKSAPEPTYSGTPDRMTAEEIARKLQEIAAVLEILGENQFKVRAYENAARVLPGMGEELVDLIQDDNLKRVRGIGRGIADKVVALAYTGKLDYFDALKARVPPGLLEMLRIPGLGPKKVKLLFDSLDLASVDALEQACRSGALKDLRGFGAKTQDNILRGIAYLRRVNARFFWGVANAHVSPVFDALRAHPAVQRAELAGSLRRRKETVHDADIVVSTEDAAAVTEHFANGDWVERVIGSGPTKTSILHPSGLQIDLRVVSDAQYPYAMHHFTGSKAHNVGMRGRAQRMGIKINEYGLFRGEDLIVCKTEAEIFAALGMQYVPPEMREDEGEIAAAENRALPTHLLEQDDVCGALHVHTSASDGDDDLETMVRTAQTLGWKFIGISDHAGSATTQGLDATSAAQQRDEIARVAKRLGGVRIFHGIEVSIAEDGSLGLPQHVMHGFDFVIASVHDERGLTREAQTKRVLRALENPLTTILGHPTGRLLFEQAALDLDLGAVFDAAAKHGVAIEINGNARRMDPDGSQVRSAAERGALLCVNPDAHDREALQDVQVAVGLARRGWVGPERVLNTWSAERVAKHFESRRSAAEAT